MQAPSTAFGRLCPGSPQCVWCCSYSNKSCCVVGCARQPDRLQKAAFGAQSSGACTDGGWLAGCTEKAKPEILKHGGNGGSFGVVTMTGRFHGLRENAVGSATPPFLKASVSSGVPPFPPCFRISGFAFAFLRSFPASLRFRLATVGPRAGQAEDVCRGIKHRTARQKAGQATKGQSCFLIRVHSR